MKNLMYLLVALFIISGCDNNSTIVGNGYKLRNAQNEAEITLGFDDVENRFFGRSGINRYFGTYKTEGNNIFFENVGSTRMAGTEALMIAERNYLQFFRDIKTYRLDGNLLILSKANGQSMVFERTGSASSLK